MVTCNVCLQSIQLEGDAVVLTADAVICGSGAGGGVAAALLAEAGAKAGPLSSLTLYHWTASSDDGGLQSSVAGIRKPSGLRTAHAGPSSRPLCRQWPVDDM